VAARWRDHRQVINPICWVKRTGSAWHDLPERYRPWKTAHQRFARWAADCTWALAWRLTPGAARGLR